MENGWYGSTGLGRDFMMYHDFDKKIKYGFNAYGEWYLSDPSTYDSWSLYSLKEISKEEVYKSLVEEARGRGFVKGNKFSNYNLKRAVFIRDERIIEKEKFSSNTNVDVIYLNDYAIMADGVWAEVERVKTEPSVQKQTVVERILEDALMCRQENGDFHSYSMKGLIEVYIHMENGRNYRLHESEIQHIIEQHWEELTENLFGQGIENF